MSSFSRTNKNESNKRKLAVIMLSHSELIVDFQHDNWRLGNETSQSRVFFDIQYYNFME